MSNHRMRAAALAFLPPILAFGVLQEAAPVCAQQPAPAAAVPQPTKEQLASAEAFAQELTAAIGSGDLERVRASFDRDAIVRAVSEGLDAKADTLEGVRKGMAKGLDNTLQQITAEWQASAPKWKRVLVVDGRVCARLRFTGAGGISIVDFVLTPHEGSWRVIDFDNRALGMQFVDQMRQSVATMMGEAGAGVLARLFGGGGLTQTDLENMRKLAAGRASGDHAGALAAHAKLPKVLQDTATITSMYVQCLAMSGDTATYVAALEAAAKRFPAPMFRFTLIDAHILKKDWAKAIACIDEALKSIEVDAAILSMRAALQLQSGDLAAAKKTLADALKLEPDCEYALLNGLDVWLAAKEWGTVRDAMKALEKHGKYDFRGSLTDEVWAEFRKTPESEPWR